MRVVVFGATGRTGRLTVERALEAGFEVVAFVRDASKLGALRERVSVVEGDVLDEERVEGAISGSDAVLSALGHVEGSPKDVQERGARNIVRAMEKNGVRRLVSLTGAGVKDPRDRPKVSDRLISGALRLLQRSILEDAEKHARVIEESDLEWTIVRVPRLTDEDGRGEYRVGYVGKESGTKVSRADVADFMAKQVEDRTYLRRAPMVSY